MTAIVAVTRPLALSASSFVRAGEREFLSLEVAAYKHLLLPCPDVNCSRKGLL